LARNRRRRIPGREGRFITNTWGDNNRDGRIAESFLVHETAAVAAVGADALQVDDGWQRGVTANSVAAAGAGAWDGFYAADPGFWTPHPVRMPHGLGPVADAAHAHGIDLGLWFAPDSARDFVNWQRDAAVLADLRRRQGVAHWKFDAVKLRSRAGELNLQRLLERLWSDSGGQAWLDLDITAENRPGFLGADPFGSLFVQNRYSASGSWWPHETLRTLWELAWWIPPQRLRIEFLNPERNLDIYGDDPLAPARYGADWPFATTLVANPLGWFEASGLSPAFADAVGSLARIWKGQRDELHAGTILPVGTRPSGASTCGFVSLGVKAAHLLVFREPLAAAGSSAIALPPGAPDGPWQLIAGSGSLESGHDGVRVHGLGSPAWGWWRAEV
jgi:alpha-galactosidase